MSVYTYAHMYRLYIVIFYINVIEVVTFFP